VRALRRFQVARECSAGKNASGFRPVRLVLPRAGGPDPMAMVARVLGRDPDLSAVGRSLPVAGFPSPMITVPPVKAWHPYVFRAWRWANLFLDEWAGRRRLAYRDGRRDLYRLSRGNRVGDYSPIRFCHRRFGRSDDRGAVRRRRGCGPRRGGLRHHWSGRTRGINWRGSRGVLALSCAAG
jgi:hypothetical protein